MSRMNFVRMIQRMIALAVIGAMIGMLSGCFLFESSREEERMFREKIDAFCAAAQSGDADAVKDLLAVSARKDEISVSKEITALLKSFPRGEIKVLFDGLLSGSYSQADGKQSSSVNAVFPIMSDGEYWWIFMELTYRNDFDADDVGLNRIFVYNAAAYLSFDQNDLRFPLTEGIQVTIFEDVDKNPICCVNGSPVRCTGSEGVIKLEDAKEFLNNGDGMAEFVAEFGEAYAKKSFYGAEAYHYYRLAGEDMRFLRLDVLDGRIICAEILGEIEHIDVILE